MSIIKAKSINFTGTQSTLNYSFQNGASGKIDDRFLGKDYLQKDNCYISSTKHSEWGKYSDITYGTSDITVDGLVTLGINEYNYNPITDYRNPDLYVHSNDNTYKYLYTNEVVFSTPALTVVKLRGMSGTNTRARHGSMREWQIGEVSKIILPYNSTHHIRAVRNMHTYSYSIDDLEDIEVHDTYYNGDLLEDPWFLRMNTYESSFAFIVNTGFLKWRSRDDDYGISEPSAIGYANLDDYIDSHYEPIIENNNDTAVKEYIRQKLKAYQYGVLRVDLLYCFLNSIDRENNYQHYYSIYYGDPWNDDAYFICNHTYDHRLDESFRPCYENDDSRASTKKKPISPSGWYDLYIPFLSEDEYHAAKCALEEWSHPTIEMFSN